MSIDTLIIVNIIKATNMDNILCRRNRMEEIADLFVIDSYARSRKIIHHYSVQLSVE